MHCPIPGVGVSRRSLPLIPAAAPLAVVVTCLALGMRLLPAGGRTRRYIVGRKQCYFGTHQRQRRRGQGVS